MDPEQAHHRTMAAMRRLHSMGAMGILRPKLPTLESKVVAGIRFPNPLGLAAGFDKNAQCIDPLADLGFGFIEIGTVTPVAQEGNPRPRLFRLPQDEALLNRMGFNNAGVDAAVENLRKRKTNIPIGGNIGKNKSTDNSRAREDYTKAFRALYPWVDYFVVNVSSPNTPNLRELQDKEPLRKLLHSLQEINTAQEQAKPIFMKMAPDLSKQQIDDVLDISRDSGLAGVVATNTTIARNIKHYSASYVEALGAGGISGRPLTEVSLECIKYISDRAGDELAIIAVGGIFSAEDAQNMLDAGADLVQIYSGFVYRGPQILADILNNIKY